jgi:hypothetical protein
VDKHPNRTLAAALLAVGPGLEYWTDALMHGWAGWTWTKLGFSDPQTANCTGTYSYLKPGSLKIGKYLWLLWETRLRLFTTVILCVCVVGGGGGGGDHPFAGDFQLVRSPMAVMRLR